ncbi:MAG: hypothetical protein HY869_09000 [Chloroflexi bacterium]|nr:hypothetical protein [Chloroflexota bacterium]
MQPKMPVKKFGLSDLLREMVEEADRRPCQKIRRKLKRGLKITVTNQMPMYHLVLKRKESMPTYAEWDAVCKAWPWVTSAAASESTLARLPYLQGWVGPRPMLL